MEPVARVAFTDGILRPVFEDDGRQYVTDGEGNRVYGVWPVPRDDVNAPIVIDTGGGETPV